jgi:hypothetical protein
LSTDKLPDIEQFIVIIFELPLDVHQPKALSLTKPCIRELSVIILNLSFKYYRPCLQLEANALSIISFTLHYLLSHFSFIIASIPLDKVTTTNLVVTIDQCPERKGLDW